MIQQLKRFSEPVYTVILFIAVLIGIAHSKKNHGGWDTVAAVVIPPFAIYRAVETMWHKSEPPINWDKKLENDISILVYFCSQATDVNSNKYQLTKDIQNFKEDLGKYPEEQKEELKKMASILLNYLNSTTGDIGKHTLEMMDGATTVEDSNKTKLLKHDLNRMGLQKIVHTIDSIKAAEQQQMVKTLILLPDEQKEVARESLRAEFDLFTRNYQKETSSLFEEIFESKKEEY